MSQHGGPLCTKSASRFEELDGIPVRILDLDLSTTRTGLRLINSQVRPSLARPRAGLIAGMRILPALRC